MAMVDGVLDGPGARKDEIFSHPRGLVFLAGTEGFERFSYYGMQSLLVLYLVGRLLKPGVSDHVLGFASFHAAMQAVFGKLSITAFATQTFGLYGGLVYLAPIAGGLVGDHWLGRRRAVTIGLLFMALGHFMMAFEPMFLIALASLLTGCGFMKGNISAQVGGLYSPGDPRRDQAFSIFYMTINIGGFFAPLVCGTLGEVYGWHLGFGMAGVIMLIGVGFYLSAGDNLPADPPRLVRAAQPALQKGDAARIAALAVLVVVAALFWTAQSQIWDTYNLWVRDRVDRHLFGAVVPVTWFQSIDAIGAVVLAPVVLWLWRRQAARGTEPSEVGKLTLGCVMFAVTLLVLALAELVAGKGLAPIGWAVAYHTTSAVGYLYFVPVAMALASRIAPPALGATALSIYLLSVFAGSVASGWLGRFYGVINGAEFWAIHAGICATGAVVLLIARRPLIAILRANTG